MTNAELMHTDDRGTEFWRVREAEFGACAWCGLATHYTWRNEDAKPLGRACSLRCAVLRTMKPVAT
jgi:hypothetical protein